uniref:Uncharacterized protein n=1 Tax=Cacopsylla melanoneura TaxID=428564 RepID=A0A8D8SP23_9HEMI
MLEAEKTGYEYIPEGPVAGRDLWIKGHFTKNRSSTYSSSFSSSYPAQAGSAFFVSLLQSFLSSFLSDLGSHNVSIFFLVCPCIVFLQLPSLSLSSPHNHHLFSQRVQYQCSLLSYTFFDTSVTLILFLIVSFLILSNLITPRLHLSILI